LETTGDSGGAVPGGNPVAGPRGLVDVVLSLIGAFGQYAESLGALAGEEAREAGVLYLRLALLLGGALFFLAFGYLLLVLFVAVLLATVFHVSWIWILLAFTVLHFVGAICCGVLVRSHWKTPIFSATRKEISRDLAGLRGGRTP